MTITGNANEISEYCTQDQLRQGSTRRGCNAPLIYLAPLRLSNGYGPLGHAFYAANILCLSRTILDTNYKFNLLEIRIEMLTVDHRFFFVLFLSRFTDLPLPLDSRDG